MDTIAGLPFFPLEITKEGTLFSAQQRSAIENAASQAGAGKVTDFFVISHGWNNDMADARDLYNGLFANVAALIPEARVAGRQEVRDCRRFLAVEEVRGQRADTVRRRGRTRRRRRPEFIHRQAETGIVERHVRCAGRGSA